MLFGKKGDSNNDLEGLKKQLVELQRQNKIMREALEFYSDPKTWQQGHKYVDADNATIFTDGSDCSAIVDKGAQAYRALEACK